MKCKENKIPTYCFPSCGYISEGDTIFELPINFKEGYDGDLTTASLEWVLFEGNTKILDLSEGNGLTVTSPTTFVVDEINPNPLPAKTFKGYFRITEADGKGRKIWNLKYTISK